MLCLYKIINDKYFSKGIRMSNDCLRMRGQKVNGRTRTRTFIRENISKNEGKGHFSRVYLVTLISFVDASSVRK